MKIKLKDNYDNDFNQFVNYSDMYGISERLGFDSPEEAWDTNPLIQVTTNPNDLKVIKE